MSPSLLVIVPLTAPAAAVLGESTWPWWPALGIVLIVLIGLPVLLLAVPVVLLATRGLRLRREVSGLRGEVTGATRTWRAVDIRGRDRRGSGPGRPDA